MNLSNNVGWRQINSDSSQPSEEPLPVETHFSKLPVNFLRASRIQAKPSLFFGDKNLDRFLGGLPLGHTVFFYGSWQCLATSEFLCIKAQLDSHNGGLDSEAIFVDGGNTFDPYLMVQYVEQFSLDRDQVLDRIFVSRAFTCHQLTSFITQILPRAVHAGKIKFIIASDMIELYRDPDVHYAQSLRLFKTALNSLANTARLERSLALATSLDENTSDSDPFLRAAKEKVDIVLRFEERRQSTKLMLEKHPTRPEETFLIKPPAPRVLEEFLEATING